MEVFFQADASATHTIHIPFLFFPSLQRFTHLNKTRPREGAKRSLTVSVSSSEATAEHNGGSGVSQTGNTLPFNQRQSERKQGSAIQTSIMLITLRLGVLMEDLAR